MCAWASSARPSPPAVTGPALGPSWWLGLGAFTGVAAWPVQEEGRPRECPGPPWQGERSDQRLGQAAPLD